MLDKNVFSPKILINSDVLIKWIAASRGERKDKARGQDWGKTIFGWPI